MESTSSEPEATPFDFSETVACVTGSTRGIGWATARSLAAGGADVAINGHSDPSTVRARCRELEETFDIEALPVPADVSEPDDLEQMFADLKEQWGRLDLLVNNAGFLHDGMLMMTNDATLDRITGTNLDGPTRAIREAIRLLRRSDAPSIVNVTSVFGLEGQAGNVAYAAAKAGLVGLTKAAAKELARWDIRCNAVAPGVVDTDLVDHLDEDRCDELCERIPLDRFADPDEVADAICFLASPSASYITGEVIRIDGGFEL